VRKVVRERIAEFDESMERDEVVIDRVPIDRVIAESIPPRREGDTLVLSRTEEVLIKQLRLVEEVRITMRRRVSRPKAAIPLRHEEVIVERNPPIRERSG
jgi:hypothetical protein